MSRQTRSEFRKLGFPEKKDSYAILPGLQLLYRELQPLQNVALNSLVSRDWVDIKEYKNNIVHLDVKPIPPNLLDHLDTRAEEQRSQLSFLLNTVGAMPLDGAGGLMRNLKLERGGKLK